MGRTGESTDISDTAISGKKLFCFGFGYSCAFLARALMDEGWDVSGTTRDKSKHSLMRQGGIHPYFFERTHPIVDPLGLLRDTTHLLLSIPPGDRGDPVAYVHGQDIARLKKLEWVGYLSTTGVYGDCNGQWVDEHWPVAPTSQRGSRRALAEQQWLDHWRMDGVPVHIFRLAGIYGPGRSALDAVRAGTARRIDKPGHAFNRIHVDDIVQVLRASIAQPSPGAIYNLADDEPVPSHEVITYACELLGKEPPPMIPFDVADMAPMARSFYMDNKRVRNDKIKTDLGVKLKYPDYRSGIKACLESGPHVPFLEE